MQDGWLVVATCSNIFSRTDLLCFYSVLKDVPAINRNHKKYQRRLKVETHITPPVLCTEVTQNRRKLMKSLSFNKRIPQISAIPVYIFLVIFYVKMSDRLLIAICPCQRLYPGQMVKYVFPLPSTRVTNIFDVIITLTHWGHDNITAICREIFEFFLHENYYIIYDD